MTSSETPSEPETPASAPEEKPVPEAGEAADVAPEPVAPPAEPPPVTAAEPAARLPRARAVSRPFPMWALPLVVLPPGWFYILQVARWHVTPSTVLLMLCWAAVVGTGYAVVRMATATAAASDEGWFSVRGRSDELELEKRSLLKALKDIEFDLQTGKLSAADAAVLTASYRARAIEVIKAIEAEAGVNSSVREQILAEARARAAVDAKVKAKVAKTKSKKEKAA